MLPDQPLLSVPGIGKVRAKILADEGFHIVADVKKNPLNYFRAVKKHAAEFVVRHHDPEKILLHIFGLKGLEPLETYSFAINRLPARLWCGQNSVFSILGHSSHPYLSSMHVHKTQMERAQGALLNAGVYRLRHLERWDPARKKRFLEDFCNKV